MKQDIREELEVFEGISISVANGIFTVKGAKGELQKRLHNPKIKSSITNNLVVFEAKKGTQREKRLIKAYIAHLKSIMRGVKETHTYKLRICSGHFPMTVSVKGNVFEIKNFVGETVPRTLALPEGVKVSVDGHFILVESINKEKAGQTASLIEKLTRRAAFDKRIFQDGIYVIEKDGKPIIK
nr:large subunit ribosomal protein L6 [uncultured archaeon]